jgi:outer membrane protein TolC
MDYETQEKLRPTKEEREAKKEQARKDAEKALIALKKADEAFRANFERLKAERRARESAETKS